MVNERVVAVMAVEVAPIRPQLLYYIDPVNCPNLTNHISNHFTAEAQRLRREHRAIFRASLNMFTTKQFSAHHL